MTRSLTLITTILILCGCATSEQPDPWEGFNRKTTGFNDGVDAVLLKPLAMGYQAVTPDVAERGVSNFLRIWMNLRQR